MLQTGKRGALADRGGDILPQDILLKELNQLRPISFSWLCELRCLDVAVRYKSRQPFLIPSSSCPSAAAAAAAASAVVFDDNYNTTHQHVVTLHAINVNLQCALDLMMVSLALHLVALVL